MKIEIRRAAPKDIPDLQEILKEGEDLHANLLPGHFIYRKKKWPIATMKSWIHPQRNGRFYLVATIDSKPIGLIHGRKAQYSGNTVVRKVNTLVIEMIIVHSKFQRLGVGYRLIREVEKYAKAKRYKRLVLNVFEKNKGAIAFYEKAKFGRLSVKMEKEI